MTNGGTGPFNSKLVLANSGRGPLPPSLALVDPTPPHNTTVLLDNFFGRQFNSLNDVKIHPGSNKLFFTDVTCVPEMLTIRTPTCDAFPIDTDFSTISVHCHCCQTKCTASTPTPGPCGW